MWLPGCCPADEEMDGFGNDADTPAPVGRFRFGMGPQAAATAAAAAGEEEEDSEVGVEDEPEDEQEDAEAKAERLGRIAAAAGRVEGEGNLAEQQGSSLSRAQRRQLQCEGSGAAALRQQQQQRQAVAAAMQPGSSQDEGTLLAALEHAGVHMEGLVHVHSGGAAAGGNGEANTGGAPVSLGAQGVTHGLHLQVQAPTRRHHATQAASFPAASFLPGAAMERRASGSAAGPSLPSAAAAEARPHAALGFMPAASFQGPRPFMVFKRDYMGLGYYPDSSSRGGGGGSGQAGPDNGSSTPGLSKRAQKRAAKLQHQQQHQQQQQQLSGSHSKRTGVAIAGMSPEDCSPSTPAVGVGCGGSRASSQAKAGGLHRLHVVDSQVPGGAAGSGEEQQGPPAGGEESSEGEEAGGDRGGMKPAPASHEAAQKELIKMAFAGKGLPSPDRDREHMAS